MEWSELAQLPAHVVAPRLLGAVVTVGEVSVEVTEVEAYCLDDAASHAFAGRTARNEAMFGPPGTWYVYISYGIHVVGNLVCGPVDTGQAVLLRGGVVHSGHAVVRSRRGTQPEVQWARGPGNFGQALGLDLGFNGQPAVVALAGNQVEYCVGPRVGISKNVDAPLRFWIPDEPTVSAFRPGRTR